MNRYILAALGLALAVGTVLPGLAQTTAETNAPGVQLNFSTPGARSLGLGGAFLALADDATAAYANPAGLIRLPFAEVSVEGREAGFVNTFVDSGEGLGSLRISEDESRISGPSFVSFVYPRKRWAVGVYRHELANFNADWETQGAVLRDTPELRTRIFPAATRLDLEIVNWGVSGAFRVQKWAFGAGLAYRDFSLASRTDRFWIESFRGGPSGIFDSQTQEGEDEDWTLNLGILYFPNRRWHVGATVRQGSAFDFTARSIAGESKPEPSRDCPPASAGEACVESQVDAQYHVPWIYGLGVAFKASPRIRVTADYYRITYSDFTDGLTDIFGLEGLDTGKFTVGDADELHVGFEYFFIQWRYPFAIRAGAWVDPAHAINYRGETSEDFPAFQAIFSADRNEDDYHLSLGGGFAFLPAQVDFAVDVSERVTTVSISTVVRFGTQRQETGRQRK